MRNQLNRRRFGARCYDTPDAFPVAFDDVAQALTAAASTMHAAEAHGCLCGALCARRTYSLVEWLDDILPATVAAAPGSGAEGSFADLHEATARFLAAPDMEFAPLLPDDDVELGSRAEALGAWCQGFLYGFGTSGTAPKERLPEEVAEVLSDLANISLAGGVGSESSETEEESYAELVEYVRAAVQLVHDDLAGLRAGQPPQQPSQ